MICVGFWLGWLVTQRNMGYQPALAWVISCTDMCGTGYQPALKHVGNKAHITQYVLIKQLKHSLWSLKGWLAWNSCSMTFKEHFSLDLTHTKLYS